MSSPFTTFDTKVYRLDQRLDALRECLKIGEKVNGLVKLISDAKRLQLSKSSDKLSNIIAKSENELLSARLSSREKACPLSPLSTQVEINQLSEKRQNLVKMSTYFKNVLGAPLGVPVSPNFRGGKSISKTKPTKIEYAAAASRNVIKTKRGKPRKLSGTSYRDKNGLIRRRRQKKTMMSSFRRPQSFVSNLSKTHIVLGQNRSVKDRFGDSYKVIVAIKKKGYIPDVELHMTPVPIYDGFDNERYHHCVDNVFIKNVFRQIIRPAGYTGTIFGRAEFGMQNVDGIVVLEPGMDFYDFAVSKGFKLL